MKNETQQQAGLPLVRTRRPELEPETETVYQLTETESEALEQVYSMAEAQANAMFQMLMRSRGFRAPFAYDRQNKRLVRPKGQKA
jgi:hypothetical protein